MNSIVRRIGAGAGPTGQNVQVLPFDQRPDFDPARMTEDNIAYFAESVFSTILGNWDVSAHPCSIDQESRNLYLKPFGDPEYYDGGGGDHDIHVKVVDVDGRPLVGAGIAFASDGIENLQPPNATVTRRDTEAHGWCNLPIFAPSFPPANLGPWATTKLSEAGAADIIHGIGMWNGHHTSVFVVYRAVRWGDLQPAYPTLAAQLIGEAEKQLVMPLNPEAALQKRILDAGFIPNSREFETERDGVRYVAQRGENGRSREVRVYYVQIGDWGNVKYEVRP